MRLTTVAFLLVATGGFFGLGMTAISLADPPTHSIKPQVNPSPEPAQSTATSETAAGEEAETQLQDSVEELLASPADPSFAARENADFLLTPLLLVQRQIDNSLVVIYPAE